MGSHAGRLALAGLLDGPFITIERGPKIKHGSSIFKLCHNRGLSTLFLVRAPHQHQQKGNKGQKRVTASPTKGCSIGQKKGPQQCHFQKQALLQFCDLSNFWFTPRKFSPSHLRYVTFL